MDIYVEYTMQLNMNYSNCNTQLMNKHLTAITHDIDNQFWGTNLWGGAVWASCSIPPLHASGELCKTPCMLPLLSPAGVPAAHPLEHLWAHPSFGTGHKQPVLRDIVDDKTQIFYPGVLADTACSGQNKASLPESVQEWFNLFILECCFIICLYCHIIDSFLTRPLFRDRGPMELIAPSLPGAWFCVRTYFGGLLVWEDLRVDSVELQDELVHQLRVQPPVTFEEVAILDQLLMKTVCPCWQRQVWEMI